MKIILVGYGNVGKELEKVLKKNGIIVDLIVRSSGIYNVAREKLAEVNEFTNHVDENSMVFISTPSQGQGEFSALYYIEALKKRAKIVTCEKAFLAAHWGIVSQYPNQIKYGATVGGGSGILNAISDYKGEIREIRAVINGTLNYSGERLGQGLSEDEVYKEVTSKGFAEPGATIFGEVVEGELKDVQYKTVVVANHSKLYEKVITIKDVIITPYQKGVRCSICLSKEEIKAGFIEAPDEFTFPSGVNNCLYINGQKIVEGPGAGARPTAERMFRDASLL